MDSKILYEMFYKKNEFCQLTDCLISLMDRENNDSVVKDRLDKLKTSIESCFKNFGRVYVFGSRLYGIAKDNSDVDLYFDIGDCFSGKIADDCVRQLQLINQFVGAVNEEFIELEVLSNTRVPIVQFSHKSTNFKCDMHFRSGLSVLSSKLVKLYLSMDERVRWVVVAVKHWAVTLNLISNDFSSFSLIWLVLFVMMLYQIVPPIIHLWKMQNNNESHYTEGWDTRICFYNNEFVSSISTESTYTKWDLLRRVFEFYSNSNKLTLQNCVLSTVFGEIFPKKTFYSAFIAKANTLGNNYRPQIEKFERCKTLINVNFGNFNRIELQNPLKLCNNVIPWLNDKNMKLFMDLCTKSASCV